MEKHKTVSECWKALAGCRESCCGLRSIPVAEYGGREIRAGIFFPEGTEALLTGFSEHIPLKLPQGYGFRVEALGGDVPDSSRHWLAIIRTFCGDTELFAIMAEDLKAVLEKRQFALSAFLDRVQAWQTFMEQKHPPVMSEHTETGLFGELVVLKRLMETLGEQRAVQAWKGPDGGLQDFRLEELILEVKTSSAPKGFPITVCSLEQLDEGLAQCPLYLAGVRLRRDEEGTSVSDLVEEMVERLRPNDSLLMLFERLLIRMGYVRGADMGKRRFSTLALHVIQVSDALPHLRRSLLPEAFLSASYSIDIDRTHCSTLHLEDLIREYCHG